MADQLIAWIDRRQCATQLSGPAFDVHYSGAVNGSKNAGMQAVTIDSNRAAVNSVDPVQLLVMTLIRPADMGNPELGGDHMMPLMVAADLGNHHWLNSRITAPLDN